MAFNELVVRALGEDRVRRMTEGTQKLVDKAEAAPRCTDSFVHLTIPLSAKDPDAADRELGELLARSDPNADWSYFTLVTPTGGGSPERVRFFVKPRNQARQSGSSRSLSRTCMCDWVLGGSPSCGGELNSQLVPETVWSNGMCSSSPHAPGPCWKARPTWMPKFRSSSRCGMRSSDQASPRQTLLTTSPEN